MVSTVRNDFLKSTTSFFQTCVQTQISDKHATAVYWRERVCWTLLGSHTVFPFFGNEYFCSDMRAFNQIYGISVKRESQILKHQEHYGLKKTLWSTKTTTQIGHTYLLNEITIWLKKEYCWFFLCSTCAVVFFFKGLFHTTFLDSIFVSLHLLF